MPDRSWPPIQRSDLGVLLDFNDASGIPVRIEGSNVQTLMHHGLDFTDLLQTQLSCRYTFWGLQLRWYHQAGVDQVRSWFVPTLPSSHLFRVLFPSERQIHIESINQHSSRHSRRKSILALWWLIATYTHTNGYIYPFTVRKWRTTSQVRDRDQAGLSIWKASGGKSLIDRFCRFATFLPYKENTGAHQIQCSAKIPSNAHVSL